MIDTETLRGTPFLQVFDIKRPRDVQAVTDLALAGGTKLHLTLRKPPHTALKGVVVPMDGAGGNLVVNLSFGISIMDGVRDYALTNADFAATDLAIEMLYLIEAKTAAMEASRKLNLRLQGAKNVAEEAALTDTLTGLSNRRRRTVIHRSAHRSEEPPRDGSGADRSGGRPRAFRGDAY